MGSRASSARNFAAKSALVPFGLIMSHERKFGCEDPPFTGERQITKLHVFQGDIPASANLGGVFREASTQRPLAFGGSLRCFTDVDKAAFEVEGIDSTGLWSCTPSEVKQWIRL